MEERIKNLLLLDDISTMITDWEQRFLSSLLGQTKRGRKQHSVKQLDTLHRIEAKIKKAIEGDPEWEALWDEDKAWNFKTAVAYYATSPERYYRQIIDWFAQNKEKIPPKNYYKKIVENKYAQRVLDSLRGEPKYPAGSAVMLRKTARTGLSYHTYHDHQTIPLFVIEPTERAVSAAAGCRIYTVLSSTSAQMFEVEERWIKKYREPVGVRSRRARQESDVPF